MSVAPCPKRFDITRTSSGWETNSAISNLRLPDSRIEKFRTERHVNSSIRKSDNPSILLLGSFPLVFLQNSIQLRRRQVLVEVVIHLDCGCPTACADA